MEAPKKIYIDDTTGEFDNHWRYGSRISHEEVFDNHIPYLCDVAIFVAALVFCLAECVEFVDKHFND